jgi:hypothetical protein
MSWRGTSMYGLYEQMMQSVLSKSNLYRQRRDEEMCRHCGALAGEPCRNTFNLSETYSAGHMQSIEGDENEGDK